MEQFINQREATALIKAYPKYRLKKYQIILEEMIAHLGNLNALRNKHILELGPGNRVPLMQFLANEFSVASIKGAGRAPLWPWIPQRQFIKENIENTFLLDYLSQQPSEFYHIIYSRHLMEQHSIHPGILLTSQVYWRYIRENKFGEMNVDFPASRSNIQAIFREAFRCLKKGGIVISQIAKLKYAALDRPFLLRFSPTSMRERPLGRLSGIVSVVK